jgi:hypothetical protein
LKAVPVPVILYRSFTGTVSKKRAVKIPVQKQPKMLFLFYCYFCITILLIVSSERPLPPPNPFASDFADQTIDYSMEKQVIREAKLDFISFSRYCAYNILIILYSFLFIINFNL